MKIKELLFKLFKKKQPTTIARFADIIQMPTRESLMHPKKADQYKDEYALILKDNKTLLSTDFTPTKLKDNVNMYIDLLTNICYGEYLDTSSIVNANAYELSEKKCELDITRLKLKMYLTKIEDMCNEVNERLVALSELLDNLYEEKKKHKFKMIYLSDFFDKKGIFLNSKINTVEETINQFLNTKAIIESQYSAATLMVNTTQIKIDTLIDYINAHSYEKAYYETIKKYLFSERKEIVEKDLKFINSEQIGKLSYLDDLSYDVVGEILLESYIYSHKNDIEKLNDQLIKWNSEMMTSQSNIDDLKNLLPQMIELENTYNLFNRYSRGIISDEMLESLYNFKFLYYSYRSIFDDKELTFKYDDDKKIENEYFKKIILEYIIKFTNDEPFKRAPVLKKIFNELFKDSDEKFNPQDILESEMLLKMFMYLVVNGACSIADENFFNIKVRKNRLYGIKFYEDIIKWDDYISIDAICRLVNLSKFYHLTDSHFKTLCKIHRNRNLEIGTICYSSPEEIYPNSYSEKCGESLVYKDVYKVPEGIVELNLEDPYISSDSRALLETIHQKIKDKSILMPNSLKCINGQLCHFYHDKIVVQDIMLNEGLEFLDARFLENISMETLIIPSSLEKINYHYFLVYHDVIDTIKIEDYKNSKIFNSDKELSNLCRLLTNENYLFTIKRIVLQDDESKIEYVFHKSDLDSLLRDSWNFYELHFEIFRRKMLKTIKSLEKQKGLYLNRKKDNE